MLALTKMEKLERGIIGVTGKRQVSVVVSNGRKDGRSVVERDRLHIVEPTENKNKVKPYHQAFTTFNSAPPERRRSVYGILTHLREEDAFWYERKAQQFPVTFYKNLGWFKNARENQQTVAHPNRLPACCGGAAGKDGKVMARRWFGPDADDFKMIECLGERCEFAIRTSDDDKPPCGPSLEFLFQLIWKDEFVKLPSVTARYTSHGWDTLRYFIGFFNEIAAAVTALGIDNPVLYGFPFMMSLAEKTKPSKRWNWPVVTISPMITPLEFFYAQIEKRKQLREMAAQIPAVITVSEEMAQRPTVYLMDEVGPIRIGKNATVIDAEPEMVENAPVAPVDAKSGKPAKSSKAGSASPESAVLREPDGKNGQAEFFPKNWPVERKKVVKRIKMAWEKVSDATLGNNIALNADKEIALAELRFRIKSWQEIYAGLKAADEWEKITVGGDIMAIPESPMNGDPEKTCLASVAAKLRARWSELKEERKAA